MHMDLIVYNIGQKYFSLGYNEVNCIRILYYIYRLLLALLRNACYDSDNKFNNSVCLSPCTS